MPSSEKIISPGVFTNEIDQTFLPAAIGDIGAALVGPTVKGPALVPVVVKSYSEFQQRFGDTFKSGSSYYQYLTSYTAREYLRHHGTLTVVRILAGSYSGASATISSSIDPGVIGTHQAARATGSITIGTNFIGNSPPSASIAGVTFAFSGSAGDAGAVNTATKIWIVSGSSAANTAAAFRDTFNNSSSLHGLSIIASAVGSTTGFTASFYGPLDKNVVGGAQRSGSFTISTDLLGQSANVITSSNSMSCNPLQGGTDAYKGAFKTSFKLHTLADGEIMNSKGPVSDKNILESGSKNNLRWEVPTVNFSKGTFTLLIRRGDDSYRRKQTLETWNNVSLDPNTNNYISKMIGDTYYSIQSSGDDPYLKANGNYPNKSKYVRVEVLEDTPEYLDENGNVRVPAASASLPSYASGSQSGSYGGSFSDGSDGTVQHPRNFWENISQTNSQGLNISNTGTTAGYNQYIDAIDLLSNQDEYDINLILAPGVVGAIHGTLATKLIDVCETRGDAFTIIDPVAHNSTISAATGEAEGRDSSYAAMYWPWVQIADPQLGKNVWVPPSVAMTGVYVFNDKVAHPWFAPAGLNRGVIDSAIQAERKLTHTDRDTLYVSSVNPIATFPGQGVVAWGQKTLQKKSSALDRVNVRRLMIKVKKFIASTSRFLVFEQNDITTRKRFLSIVNPYLEQVQANSGLNAFRVVMDDTNNTPDVVDRNILYGQIFLQPTRTAEFIILDFTVQPTGATFPE